MKCPSCGFESADGAGWCDFCKEPFRAAKPAQAPPAEKLTAEALADIVLPPDPEQVPTIPQWARLGAWIFLGLWIIFGCILAGVMKARHEAARAEAPLPASEP